MSQSSRGGVESGRVSPELPPIFFSAHPVDVIFEFEAFGLYPTFNDTQALGIICRDWSVILTGGVITI
jgi:hypothetical protein